MPSRSSKVPLTRERRVDIAGKDHRESCSALRRHFARARNAAGPTVRLLGATAAGGAPAAIQLRIRSMRSCGNAAWPSGMRPPTAALPWIFCTR